MPSLMVTNPRMACPDLPSLIPPLLAMARDAGAAIMAIYQSGPGHVQHKADDSPLTAADLAAHQVLATRLAPLLPGCHVVSEEDEASLPHRVADPRFWLIDPLDGTKEFIARNGEFTVNIALIDQGRSVLGVVYAPALDALYWGGAGLGAFRLCQGSTTPLQVAPQPPGAPCRVLASKSHLNAETQAFIDRLGPVSLVQAGSSLKFCRIAEGAADLYPRLSPTCEWDTAAAQAVLEGAGGKVVDMENRPLHYGKPDILNPSFIASGELFHP